MSEFAKLEGETSANWLTRLVGMGAPQDIRADVRAILESEKEKGKTKHHLFAFIVLRLVLSFPVLFSSCIFACRLTCVAFFFCFLQVVWPREVMAQSRKSICWLRTVSVRFDICSLYCC